MRARDLFGASAFDFHPESYLIPHNVSLLYEHAQADPSIKWYVWFRHDVWPSSMLFVGARMGGGPHDPSYWWCAMCGGNNRGRIMKPGYGGQGRGIRLLPAYPALRTDIEQAVQSGEEWLVQRYIPSPLLIEGTKFTVRLYMLVTSLDPLRIYLHEEGVVKFCAAAFDADALHFDDDHAHMHITNEAFNKHHPAFRVSNDTQVDDFGRCVSRANHP